MSLDRWLGAAGVLLSLPGFLLLLFSEQMAVAVLVLALGAAVVGAAVAVYYLTNLPEYTLTSVVVELAVLEADGSRALLTKKYRIRPNYAHLDRMIHRNIAADGSVRNIRWNGSPVSQSDVRQVLGTYEVTIGFGAPLVRWKEFGGTLSYEAVNSFPGATEALHYVVDFPVRKLEICIRMPPGRKAVNPRATRKAGLRRTLRDPALTHDGRTIELRVRRPIRGAEYSIYWDW
jgi:hypothetical protein